MHLSPRQVIAFSQALNELAMASIREGALSEPMGQVAIDWSVSNDGAFSYSWRETGNHLLSTATHRRIQAEILASLGGECGGTAVLCVDGGELIFRLGQHGRQ